VAGRTLNEDDRLQTLLNLSNALIVSVKDPQPGAWKLRVVSSGESTVRVTGLSPLDFSHGFSRAPTLQLADTEPRPISGQSLRVLSTTLCFKNVHPFGFHSNYNYYYFLFIGQL